MEFFSTLAVSFKQGGIWMWPIAAFQMVSLAIIVERAIALFKNRKINQLEFVQQYEDNIRRGELDLAIQKAQANAEIFPVSKAVIAGANAAKNFGGKEEIQGKMDEVLLRENALLSKRIGFLSMIGNVATLTGLLGTITGMIKAFTAVAHVNPADKANMLANGISEAMLTTAYGLIVAIPALLAFSVLQNRANDLAEDINQGALKVFNWLSFAFDPVALRSTSPSALRGGAQAEGSRDLNA